MIYAITIANHTHTTNVRVDYKSTIKEAKYKIVNWNKFEYSTWSIELKMKFRKKTIINVIREEQINSSQFIKQWLINHIIENLYNYVQIV